MVQIPEYVSKEQMDTDRQGMPQPKVFSGAGEGLSQLGDALSNLGSFLIRRQNQKDATKGNYAFEDMKSRTLEKQYEIVQGSDPSGEGIHDSVLVEADKIYKETLQNVPQQDQEVFTQRYNIWRRQLSIDSAEKQYSQSHDYHKGEMEKISAGYATELATDPTKYDEYSTTLHKYVDDLPLNAADKKKFRDFTDTVLAEGKFSGDVAVDPEATKGKLGFPSNPTPGKTLPIITGTQPGRQSLMIQGTRPVVLEKWKEVQGTIGFQAPIVSANRPSFKNQLAGGKDKSQHLHGNALDIDVRGLTEQQKLAIIHAASAAGFNGIGVYNNSIHIDMRKGKMAWGPSTQGPSKAGYNPPGWAREALRQHMAGKTVPVAPQAGTAAPVTGQSPTPSRSGIQPASYESGTYGGVSQGGLSAIANFEGNEEKAYWDGNAYRVGHGSDTWTDESGKVHKVTKDTVISEGDARRDLERRVPEFATTVQKQIGEDAWNAMPQGAKDGLVSVAYNYGSLPSSVREAAKKGDLEATASAVENLEDNKGRRQQEAAMIRGGSTGYQLAGATNGGVDPAYQSMSLGWRLQQLNKIEALQKQQAKELQQSMRIKLDSLVDDSLAAYKTYGEFDGEEPSADMFLTAYPDDAYDRFKLYKVQKTVALTVHNIATMDVSEARALRQDALKAIPRGEHAAIFERAYEDIDAAVKQNEAEFYKRYDKIRDNLKERLEEDPQNYMLDEGLKERDRLTEQYSKMHDKIDDQQLAEFRRRLEARPDSEKNIEEAVKIGKQAALDISRARVARQEDIITSMTATGTTGVGKTKDPKEADFVRVDEVNGKKNFREYEARLQAAFATHELFDDPNHVIAQQIEALPSRVATRAGEIGKEVFEKAARDIIEARQKNPFKYANDYYPAVSSAWATYEKTKNPDDLQTAANLTMAIERTWGMDSSDLAVLSPTITTDVARHFMDPEGDTVKNMKEVLNLVNAFRDDDTKVAVVSQLIRDGLPKLVKPAIDVAVDGGSPAAVARFFEAAKIKELPSGTESEDYATLKKTVTDKFNEMGGDTYYNTTVMSKQNYDSAIDAVTLITRVAQMRMMSGEDENSAVTIAVQDFLGNNAPFEQQLTNGPSVNIMVKSDDTAYNYPRGFERATEAIFKKLHENIDKFTIIRGGDVSDIVLPSEGLVEPGNLDIDNRQVVQNQDGSISTELSFSREDNGQEVLVPQVVNGKILSQEQAWDHYKRTGEHLGKFSSPEAADKYAQALHDRQDKAYGTNFAATETAKKEYTNLLDSFKNSGVWVNNEGGYSLYDKVSGTYLQNPKTLKPLVISKDQMRAISGTGGTGSALRTIIDYYTATGEELRRFEGIEEPNIEGLD